MLRIAPVDQRDLLRGDYATFQYDISNLDSYYSRGEKIRNGDIVYVAGTPKIRHIVSFRIS